MAHDNESGQAAVALLIVLAVIVLFAIVMSQGQNGTSGLYAIFKALVGG